MFEFTFEVSGEEQVRRRLSRIVSAGQDLSPAFRKIRDRFYEGEEQQFGTEGSWGSGGWPPLSTRYAAGKARQHPGKPIMEITGKLKRSLTQSGAEGNIENISRDTLSLGTSIAYAIYHQSTEPRTTLPRRPLIELPESERREWMQIIRLHLRRAGAY